MAGIGVLSEEDIQEWFDDSNTTDLVSALYQMLDPKAGEAEMCIPATQVGPVTIGTRHAHRCMQRPPVHAWPKAATSSAGVGALLVGPPPLRADALPPKRPLHDLECHTAVQTEQHLPALQNENQLARIAARREFVLRELATRQPSEFKLSQKRSEIASKRPRGPRGRYLPQEEIAVMA